jgi:hypothetical protein
MLEDCFGLRIRHQEFHMLKSLVANRYRETYKRILARIVAGGLAHADETHVNLKNGKGYVWILANMEDVVYLYRPTREVDFLQDLLKGFEGVLVTDFYGGYDSLPCKQQKCLVHLIRDFNDDLVNSPYDEEFKALAGEFGRLLRSIVSTIDRYGLKQRHLHKHKAKVDRFFRDLAARIYRSELAEGYRKQLIKNEGKLFTFLDHDGVPWNNNNAEHAVKAFASYRRITDGQVKDRGLSAYLVLLSIYQTCKYRGVSFLKFLLSREEDVEAFCQRRRRKQRLSRLEVYPKGFPRMYRKKARSRKRGERASKGTWMKAILTFLSTRPETGARPRDIAEYCFELMKGGALVAAVSSDDRSWVDKSVWPSLKAMMKAGKVAKTCDRMYYITDRGRAWLEKHLNPAHDIRPTEEKGHLE